MIKYLASSAPCVTHGGDMSHVQLCAGLPDVEEAENIGVVDELHDDDFTLDALEDLLGTRARLGHAHPRRQDQALGNDLDRRVLVRDGMFMQ